MTGVQSDGAMRALEDRLVLPEEANASMLRLRAEEVDIAVERAAAWVQPSSCAEGDGDLVSPVNDTTSWGSIPTSASGLRCVLFCLIDFSSSCLLLLA